MIVTCDKCQSRFNLDESLIKENGAKVQCSKCRSVFTVSPSSGLPESINIDDVLPGTENPIQDTPLFPLSPEKGEMKKESDMKTEKAKGDILDELNDIDLSEIFDSAEGKTRKSIHDGIEFELDSSDSLLKNQKVSPGDLDLDFEIDDVAAKESAKSKPLAHEVPSEQKQDLDLFDLEEILEIERQPKTEKKPAPETEEIKLEFESAGTETSQPAMVEPVPVSRPEKPSDHEPASDVIDEIDLSEFQVRAEEDKQKEPETEKEVKKEKELELEFKIDVEQTPDETAREPATSIEEGPAAPMESIPQKALYSDEKPTATAFPIPVEKKRMGITARIGILILLVGVAVSGAVYLMNQFGIEIPFVSSFLGEDAQDQGNLKLVPLEADGKFIQNEKAGKLFVIKGRIRNDYPRNRTHAQVTGKLISKTKQILATRTVFCGNIIPDPDLVRLDMKVIESRLSNQAGENKINTDIKPSQILPFMIVFSSLPEDLDEYSVEVAGSNAGK
ncbi:MAG: DUF3426 domain-containing protein [Thermodesulfobacteriota bacterium]